MAYKDESECREALEKLKGLKSLSDIAVLLDIKPKNLAYILHGHALKRDIHYKEYEIPKKSGGKRKIAVPEAALKTLQQRLNVLFQKAYPVRPSAHAFIEGRGIISNAKVHLGKRHVFNLDLKDFFPAINFGRVRGMLMAKPYCMAKEAATVIAQIVCYKNSLPQGAPSSPIISNMICSKLDGELQKHAKTARAVYSRYADDITFSSNIVPFPKEIAFDKSGIIVPSHKIEQIIKSNGFSINQKKIRLSSCWQRQTVTGLTVNEKVNLNRLYIRNLRSALSKWGRDGVKATAKEFFKKYYPAHKGAGSEVKFRRVIRGRIEYVKFVKGVAKFNEHQAVAIKLLDIYHTNCLRDFDVPVVRTEGKTDWMHLVAALNSLKAKGLFKGLRIEFYKSHDQFIFGDKTLQGFCSRVSAGKIRPFKNLIICLFDRDSAGVKNVHIGLKVKEWGGNVISLLLPAPLAGANDNISIEHLYKAKDLKRKVEGRRLYFANEFDSDGKHKKNPHLSLKRKKENKGNGEKVIDCDVVDKRTNKNVALSKFRFAAAVKQQKFGFDKVDFSGFEPLFRELEEAIKRHSPTKSKIKKST